MKGGQRLWAWPHKGPPGPQGTCVLGLGEWIPIPVKQGGKISGEVFLIDF